MYVVCTPLNTAIKFFYKVEKVAFDFFFINLALHYGYKYKLLLNRFSVVLLLLLVVVVAYRREYCETQTGVPELKMSNIK